MRFTTTFAQTTTGTPAGNARDAVRKIRDGFAGTTPAVVVFFASIDYDPDILAAEMQSAFPGAVTMGCSSVGEACGEKILARSVVAMAFSEGVFDFSETALILADKGAVAKAARPDVFADATAAFRYLARDLDRPLLDLNYHEYIGFMLGDTASPFTEGVIERAGELTNVFMAGGIAADDYTFDKQTVYYKGAAYRNGAAVIALWKPANGFEVLKTQAVSLTNHQLTITRADVEKRIIWEFNGRSAVEAYSEAIGIPAEKIGLPEFDNNPLAVVVDGEPYLCTPVAQVDGKGLQMYLRFVDGMRMTVTKAGKALETTRAAFADKVAEMGCAPAAVLHINCVCRYKALRDAGQFGEFGRIFTGVPHIAFASMGEIHINMVGITSVMILFK